MSEEKPTDRLLIINVQSFEGKRRYNYLLWIQEIEMAMSIAMLTSEHNNEFDMTIFKLNSRVREWTLMYYVSVDVAFLSWLCSSDKCFMCLHHLSRHIMCAHDLLFSGEKEKITGL